MLRVREAAGTPGGSEELGGDEEGRQKEKDKGKERKESWSPPLGFPLGSGCLDPRGLCPSFAGWTLPAFPVGWDGTVLFSLEGGVFFSSLHPDLPSMSGNETRSMGGIRWSEPDHLHLPSHRLLQTPGRAGLGRVTVGTPNGSSGSLGAGWGGEGRTLPHQLSSSVALLCSASLGVCPLTVWRSLVALAPASP